MSVAATRASCSAITVGRSPAAAAASSPSVVARAIAARRWNELRVADRHEVAVLDHADHLAGGGQHREVADAAVEHVEQDLAAAAVGGDGVGGRAHHLATPGALGSTPSATTRERRSRSVTIPRRSVAEVHDHRGRAGARSSAARPRGSASPASRPRAARAAARPPVAAPGWAPARRRVVARAPRAASARRSAGPRAARAAAAPPPRGCGSTSVSSAATAAKPVGRPDSIDACPNSSPGPSEVQHAAVVDDLHRAAAHDPHVLDRARALLEDLAPGRVELDLGRLRQPLDVRAGSSASKGGCGARKSATSCTDREIYQFLDTDRRAWRYSQRWAPAPEGWPESREETGRGRMSATVERGSGSDDRGAGRVRLQAGARPHARQLRDVRRGDQLHLDPHRHVPALLLRLRLRRPGVLVVVADGVRRPAHGRALLLRARRALPDRRLDLQLVQAPEQPARRAGSPAG